MAPTSSSDSSTSNRLSKFFSSSSSSSDGKTKSTNVTPSSSVVESFSAAKASLQSQEDLELLLCPPPPVAAGPPSSRSASPAPSSRARALSTGPQLTIPEAQSGAKEQDEEESAKLSKRRSWLPGARPRARSQGKQEAPSQAWFAGHNGKPPYDTTSLLQGGQVPELCDESGDTHVHLFPPSWNRGPSFVVSSQLYASSANLVQLAHGHRKNDGHHNGRASGDIRRRPIVAATQNRQDHPRALTPGRTRDDSSSVGSAPFSWNSDNHHNASRFVALHLPIRFSERSMSEDHRLTEADVEALIDTRNMFAFLTGQSLVATQQRQTVFSLFLSIGESLQTYDFTNTDGSTFGEVANSSLENYIVELNIADVRSSREKTIEGLVLGERMRSVSLYNESFVHAVGKYDELQEISKFAGPDVKFGMISPVTRKRLERASLDLVQRQNSIKSRLVDFDFPSIFAGVMNSRQVDERKLINFNAWQSHFNATRRYVLSYLKAKYGSWPPKASSKKNDLETSGLNRIVLKSLYFDFAELYDLYVDRTSPTSRTMGTLYAGTPGLEAKLEEPVTRILRRVCDEYDRSCPPVQPPAPFDVPILPSMIHMPATSKLCSADTAVARKLATKKLPIGELAAILDRSTNPDTLANATPDKSHFVAAIRTFEAKQARGCSLSELSDLRAGMWIFLYAVLQALPMLVVDAPGITWHHGVEYFLCQPPRSGVPWARQDKGAATGRGWYSVSGGAGIVSLPSDLVDHGVEGVYQRSHCWLAASKWSANLPYASSPTTPQSAHSQYTIEDEQREQVNVRRHESKRLAPPNISDIVMGEPRQQHRLSRPSSNVEMRRRSLQGSGLEALPLPPGVIPVHSAAGQRSTSTTGSDRIPLREGTHVPDTSTERRRSEAKPAGTTFDDILGGIEKEAGKKGKK